MNSKQRKTLAAIFASPVPRSLTCRDVESVLKALDCIKTEGDGSAVTYERNDMSLAFHRPHPGKEMKPYQVKAIRGFLQNIGVKP